MGAKVDSQVAAPAEMRTPNLHRAKQSLTKECGWKDGDRGGPAQTQKPPGRKKKNRLDTNRPSHGRTWPICDAESRSEGSFQVDDDSPGIVLLVGNWPILKVHGFIFDMRVQAKRNVMVFGAVGK